MDLFVNESSLRGDIILSLTNYVLRLLLCEGLIDVFDLGEIRGELFRIMSMVAGARVRRDTRSFSRSLISVSICRVGDKDSFDITVKSSTLYYLQCSSSFAS